ncbi:MAG: isoleucine--tRNA ligase [Patescibacteria group bacterium]
MFEGEKKKTIPEREEEILKFWEKNRIFEKSLKKNKGKKTFVFYEGPPTANGMPGIHHVEGRAFKDVIPRYKTMRGFYAPRRAGWDTHGLPVEIQVEKELGLKNKQDIEKYGIAAFNGKAEESVWKYKEEWERLTKRMGFWIDLKDPYITYETSYIESLWRIIQQFWKKRFLQEDFKVVPWCTRCATGLSSHELAQGYKETTDRSVYVKFKLESNQKIGNFTTDDKTYILAWTTTPWTLPGNVGLAVNLNTEYIVMKRVTGAGRISELNILDHEYYIVAEAWSARIPLERNGGRVFRGTALYDTKFRNFKGSDLLSMSRYQPLFRIPKFENSNTSYKIYSADFVSAEDGTGVVHTAVMYGEDDYNLGKKVGLPPFHTVDERGRFIASLGDGLAGLYVKDPKTEEKIIQALKQKNLLFAEEPYTHDYPFCWRCDTPLLYYARKAWWVRTTAVKKQLLANNEKINWIPEHVGRGRFGEFLRDVRDWAFSRERYWGTPLPIWKCGKCGGTAVIGSRDELKKRAGALPRDEKGEVDLHRPYVDEITFPCAAKRCDGVMRRVPEVADVWFDSGAMPFASQAREVGLPAVSPTSSKFLYPADYISEGVDQTRGWFYTLLVIATLLGKGAPYRNVISLGILLDKNGQKMSKSKGNVVDPWTLIPKYGIDALRWYMYTINQPGDEKRFDERDLVNKYRGFIQTFWNSFVLFDTYVGESTKHKIQITNKTQSISSEAQTILDGWVLVRLEQLTAEATAALERYDITAAGRAIEEFVIADFSQWYLRRSRRRLQHPESRQEFDTAASVTGFVLLRLATLSAPFVPFLSEAIFQGLKKKGRLKEQSVHLLSWPVVTSGSSKLKAQSSKLLSDMEAARAVVAEALKLRAEAGIKVRQPLRELRITNDELRKKKDLLDLIKDEVNVKEISFGKEMRLDTEITSELKEEGMAREIIRTIQEMRRELMLTPQKPVRIRIFFTSPMAEEIIKRKTSEIQRETKTHTVAPGVDFRPRLIRTIPLEGQDIKIEMA